jgi:endoglucanase
MANQDASQNTGLLSPLPISQSFNNIPTLHNFGTNSLTLDGGDGIQIENAVNINLDIHSQRTISLWFKPEDVERAQPQVLYEEGGETRGLNIYLDQGQLYVGGWNKPETESAWRGTWLSTEGIENGRWHHVVLVLNGGATVTDGALIAYLDGQEFGRGAGSQLWEHGDNIGLGNVQGATVLAQAQNPEGKPIDETGGYGFVGEIDRLTLYNTAVAATSIPDLPQPILAVAQFDFNTEAETLVDQANIGLQQDRATLVGGATWSQDGLEGGAIWFDGQDAVVKVENSHDINLGIHDQRTIAFWFKAADLSTDTPQILYEEGSGLRGLNLYLDQGQLYVGGWNTPEEESGWSGTWFSTDGITPRQWHHVALVLDGGTTVAENRLIGYLDGQAFGQGLGSQLWEHIGEIGLGNINNRTVIGQRDSPTGASSTGSSSTGTIVSETDGYGFRGHIDQFSLYNQALDQATIQSFAAPSDPVTRFSFDTPQNNTDVDQATFGTQTDRAIAQGGATWIRNGLEAGAVWLDGEDAVVQIEDSQDINLGIHRQRTIALWFKATDLSADNPQILYKEGGGTRGLNIYLDQGQLYVGGWNTPGDESGWSGTWLSSDAVTLDGWHHVALVLDGDEAVSNNALIGYLDGQEFGRGQGSQLWEHADISVGNVIGKTVIAHTDSPTSTRTGTRTGTIVDETGDYGFKGYIDELVIYDQPLAGQTIQALTHHPPQPEPTTSDPSFSPIEVFTVNATTIGLRFTVNDIEDGGQEPYDPQPGDSINADGWLRRDGVQIGRVVGPNQDILYRFDQINPYDLDTDWAQQRSSYQIYSPSDPDYQTPATPDAVFRKSKIVDTARTGIWQFGFTKAHTLFLELDQALTPGVSYTIDLENGALTFPHSSNPSDGANDFTTETFEHIDFVYDPLNTRSEAVHVSHLGFDPDDGTKVAFLSAWLGTGDGDASVSYEVGQAFWLVDETTNEIVYSGELELAQGLDQPSNFHLNYNGTDVYRMNFGDFETSGQYRVCVDEVGCSFSFAIAETVWDDAFYTGIRGLYHQRSGIALEQPYTDWERPRSLHPDDGLKVYQSTAMLVNTGEGLLGGEGFGSALPRGNTGEIVEDAWGGWHDAGDWDRRIQHTTAVRQLLELVELFPSHFEAVNLNLPESNNGLPDIVDEALWGLDVFRRLQRADGAVSGGIEGSRGPEFGEGSWNEDDTWYVYAPDAWSTYEYASAAAKAAYVLRSYDANLAQVYQDSAIRAMVWAEANPLSDEILAQANVGQLADLKDSRNLAAAELFRLTGDQQWSQVFLETTNYTRELRDLAHYEHQLDATFVYLRTQHAELDTDLLAKMQQQFVRQANFLLRENDRFGFGELLDRWTPVGWGASGAVAFNGQTIARTHYLTADEQYRNLLIRGSQFGLGANPDNLVYTTGLGHRNPNSPLIEDMAALGTTPPPGIGVYGPYDSQRYGNFWSFGLHPEDVTPQRQLPVNESYQDFFYDIPLTEFTIQQTITPNAYAWGYLAASDPGSNPGLFTQITDDDLLAPNSVSSTLNDVATEFGLGREDLETLSVPIPVLSLEAFLGNGSGNELLSGQDSDLNFETTALTVANDGPV